MSLTPTQLFAVLTPTQQLSATLHEVGPAGPEGPPGPQGEHGTPTTIADEGVSLAPFDILNFIGSGVTAAVDAVNDRINVTIPGGGSQTPWTSDIDAAGHALNSPGDINMQSGHNIVGVGCNVLEFNSLQGKIIQLINQVSADPGHQMTVQSAASNMFINSYGSANSILFMTGENSIRLRSGAASTEMMRITDTGIGMPTPNASYKLNVTGDCNLSAGSVYRINGVALAGQTPWTQNVDAAGFNLSNVGTLGIGAATLMGTIAVEQDGPTDSGAYVIKTRSAGVLAERLRITATGNLLLAKGSFSIRAGTDGTDTFIVGNTAGSRYLTVVPEASAGGCRISYWGGAAYGAITWYSPLIVEGKIQSNTGGFQFPGGTIQLTAFEQSTLVSVAPTAGSKKLWYDPADGNRVKYVP